MNQRGLAEAEAERSVWLFVRQSCVSTTAEQIERCLLFSDSTQLNPAPTHHEWSP